ncbi:MULTISPECIES: FMN-binding negative transcriptional regulator [unclassified Azospirillum]|uniref:FMN-binding negative transcriptional regulator n=1 Tax=unclassified Azospirillum TaxID=2630922 RepID=UPI000B6A5DA2|nr:MULTISPECIES: FMN-binding negative transcriptional regulator [unclassified Azospirillum]SNS42418.1 negative transcriptional regulator, PaiB family [Azospirillum sp. RU38E]SNS61109.1 negative transcriptional regulator, PaiB family [Azospirillum sp. RU37A]
MYIPAAFRMETDAALALVAAHPFATLVSLGSGGLLSTPLPLLLDRQGNQVRLIGHIARANPHWRDFDPAVPSLAVFQGGDAYVTPSWYAAKQETGKVVPTWNYKAVHIHGTLRLVEEPAALLDIVTRLTDRHEADRPMPWAVSDAPADYLATMLKAIVGLELLVERVEGKAKLSQNRPAEDQAAVRAGLAGVLDM